MRVSGQKLHYENGTNTFFLEDCSSFITLVKQGSVSPSNTLVSFSLFQFELSLEQVLCLPEFPAFADMFSVALDIRTESHREAPRRLLFLYAEKLPAAPCCRGTILAIACCFADFFHMSSTGEQHYHEEEDS